MWGLLVFAPLFGQYVQPALAATLGNVPFIGALFRGPPLGIGLLTAGIILAIMIIPFIAAVMRDVFLVTPAMLKESAYALGATTWEVMWQVVLSYTKVGVIGGIMLGLGRALGETMAVTFVIGNTNFLINVSLFSAREQHHLGARERVPGGRSGPAFGRADRARPDPVPHHVPRARRLEAPADAGCRAAKAPDVSATMTLHAPPQARQPRRARAVARRDGVRPVLAARGFCSRWCASASAASRSISSRR